MKQKTKKVTNAILVAACALSVGAGFAMLPTGVGAEVVADENGMRVAMTQNWASSTGQNGTLTVQFEETSFESDEYFAIDMRAYEATLNGASNQYCPQVLFDGAAKATTTFTVGNNFGNDYSVDYKNGGYIYMPADMCGVVYVPASVFTTSDDTSLSSITLNWSNHSRTMTANYYSFFKAEKIGDKMTAENVIFDFNALKTDATGAVTDENVIYSNVLVTKEVSAVGFATTVEKEFTVTTPTDSFANTYFTATFPETEFATGDYLAIDLKVKSAAFSGGASSNYAFQLKLNGAMLQHPSGVYKQTFGAEFGTYQRGGTGVGYFGNGIWFFMNADLDAILYIPAEKLLTGTSSANAVLQTKISSLTIDYASGNAGRQTTVAYNGIFKATKVGETMNADNCMYDFTQVSTDENGTINDSTLTVAKLTAAVSETQNTAFVADMAATNLRAEETYALNDGEKLVEAVVANGSLENAETLAVRFKQTDRNLDASQTGLKAKIALKFKNYAGLYSFGENVTSVPALVSGEVKNLTIENGYVTMEEGTDTTVYLPLKGIYQALPQNAEIEKIVITYMGNDFGIGEFLLRKDYNGDKAFKTLSVTLSGDENVTLAKYSATVSECENGAVAFDSEKYGEGAQATVTVTPEEGYQLLSLIVNGEDVTAAVNAGIYTFTITENATAVANFMPALTNDNFYFDGASIRWKKSTDTTGDGIRFVMLMEKSLYEALTARGDVSFGTVLLPEDLLPEDQALTVDTALAKVTDTTEIWTEIDVDGKAYMRSIVYLWGIPEQSYSRGVFARGYIAIGEKYFYTAESEARSITYVAQKAYADSSTDETEKGYCAAYFPVVTFDGGEGVGVMENVTLTDGVTYVLPTCSIQAPEGKTFGGYLVNGKTYAVGDEIVVSGKTVVTIVWL